MLQQAGVCTWDFVVDPLESRTATKLGEELDFKMWTIETMAEKTPRALQNSNDRNGKQKNNNEIQAIEM